MEADRTHWPEIAVAGWAQTKRSLHLYAQMLGKLRVALSPAQPNWMFTRLYLTPRGITTGAIPFEGGSFDGSLDVFDSRIVLRRSTGAEERIALLPPRMIAEVYATLGGALARLGVRCTISAIPQEIPDTTPFHEDTRECSYDPVAVQRWFTAATAAAGVFEAWRWHFFGRSGIQLWWGAFDVALVLFNGRKAQAPADRGYLMQYDLDAELMNVGLYLGDHDDQPFFYGYIYPQPPGASALPIAPANASWSAKYGEWVLPYEAVSAAADPEAELRTFIDAIYRHALTVAGWKRDELTYAVPKAHRPDR